MSTVKIQGNVSGSGAFTIVAPASSSDRTLTLPDNTGTLITTASTFAGTGPAFSATVAGNQSVTGSVWTKIAFSVEGFDTNNNYDTSLYRFTPSVAGYYQFNLGVISVNATDLSQAVIYKNGSGALGAYPTAGQGITVGGIVYLNGSTDYVEAYTIFTVNSAIRDLDIFTYFQGFLARAA